MVVTRFYLKFSFFIFFYSPAHCEAAFFHSNQIGGRVGQPPSSMLADMATVHYRVDVQAETVKFLEFEPGPVRHCSLMKLPPGKRGLFGWVFKNDPYEERSTVNLLRHGRPALRMRLP